MSVLRIRAWLKAQYDRHFVGIWIGQAIGFLLIGFAIAWMVTSRTQTGKSTSASTAQDAAHAHLDQNEQPTIWTCSMHPQIRRDGPGKCPLCGMDLVPVKASSGGLRTVTVSPAARSLMNIETSPVERKYVTSELRLVGKVEFDETRLKHITAWVEGRLDRLYVDYAGIEVKEGDHLVYLYSEELYSAQAELLQAIRRANEQTSPNSLTRPRDFIESSREKLRLLGLNEQQIQEIEQRGTPSEHMTIYSPTGGVVIEKLRQQGDRVRTGDRIYTVADLNQVWVKLDAYESDLAWLRFGQSVAFTTEAYPGEEFKGQVAFIDPVLDSATRTVKVRVNVDNSDGRLKPEMFVSAVIRSTIAAGGRVLDPSLAGKWISPMHPEIIKDEPGVCDICGMPLVRAESLGYVVAETGSGAKPLVIPVSAALVTGTRAIVYVEESTAEEPTFHGREILLGPRAGDYYIVRNGLNDDDVVVTQGNFKLDSALQISAKPSMMTPSGGGGAGGHDHGGESKSTGGSGAMAGQVELPESTESEALAFLIKAELIRDAVEKAEIETIQQAFTDVAIQFQRIDSSILEGHPEMVWQEFEMLFSNDFVEGGEIKSMQEADEVFLQFVEHVSRFRNRFGLHDGRQIALPVSIGFPSEFRDQLGWIWQAYAPLAMALSNDDFALSMQNLAGLQAALDAIRSDSLDDEQLAIWNRERSNLASIIEKLKASTDLATIRESFALLSEEIHVLLKSFQMTNTGTIFEHHCPMAFKGRGASWFQPDEATRNPYFGASMLPCADSVKQVAPLKMVDRATEPNVHQH